jgi:hypothetical protein
MIDVRVALRGIFGLSALLAGGGALASAPTSPQTIVLLHSFDPASEGSYPVPGLTLNSDTNLLWGVLTVPPGGSASTPAPGVLFTMYGFNTVTSTGTTSIASVAIPPLAGSATYYALSFDPNDGSGGGLLFGTSYGDPTLVAGRPQDGAIFQFDPHLGSMAGVLLTSGFTVIQDFNAGGLAGFNDSLGGIGYIRPSSTTYLVGSANDATRFGIYSFPYSTAPSAGSFITSSVGTGFNMSPPVEDPISSAWADFSGFEGLSSTTGDTFAIQGCGGGGCPGNTDFYTNARTGTQARLSREQRDLLRHDGVRRRQRHGDGLLRDSHHLRDLDLREARQFRRGGAWGADPSARRVGRRRRRFQGHLALWQLGRRRGQPRGRGLPAEGWRVQRERRRAGVLQPAPYGARAVLGGAAGAAQSAALCGRLEDVQGRRLPGHRQWAVKVRRQRGCLRRL